MKILCLSILMFSSSLFAANLTKSSFHWKGTKLIGEGHHGTIKLKESKVKVKDKKFVSGEFVMDMDSIDCDDLDGKWKNKFLAHIKNEDFFEVNKYKTAKLVVDKVDGNKAYGKVTIKDVTKEISFPISSKGNTYSGMLTIDRTKFGVTYGSGNFFKNLGDKTISDDFTINYEFTIN